MMNHCSLLIACEAGFVTEAGRKQKAPWRCYADDNT